MSNFNYVTGSVTGAYQLAGTPPTTLPVTLHQNPGIGNILICAAVWDKTVPNVSISDPNNGQWLPIGYPLSGTTIPTSLVFGQLFYTIVKVNAVTVVTMTASVPLSIMQFEIAEYSFVGTLNLEGVVYANPTSAGGLATISGLTTVNPDALIVASCLKAPQIPTAGTGFTGRNDTNAFDQNTASLGNNYSTNTGSIIEDKVGVSGGAQTATVTIASGIPTILGMAGFAGIFPIPVTNFGEDGHWSGEIY